MNRCFQLLAAFAKTPDRKLRRCPPSFYLLQQLAVWQSDIYLNDLLTPYVPLKKSHFRTTAVAQSACVALGNQPAALKSRRLEFKRCAAQTKVRPSWWRRRMGEMEPTLRAQFLMVSDTRTAGRCFNTLASTRASYLR